MTKVERIDMSDASINLDDQHVCVDSVQRSIADASSLATEVVVSTIDDNVIMVYRRGNHAPPFVSLGEVNYVLVEDSSNVVLDEKLKGLLVNASLLDSTKQLSLGVVPVEG